MNTKRFWSGFGWGVLATVGMSIPSGIASRAHLAPCILGVAEIAESASISLTEEKCSSMVE